MSMKNPEFSPELSISESERIKQALLNANEHRDYSIYTRSMDAALEAKIKSLFPYFKVQNQGVIVDAGSGTGAVAQEAARTFRESGVKVFALDISHELLALAENDRGLIRPIYGNAAEQNFPENSVNIKFFSTSGHEVESFGGKGSMRRAVAASKHELIPGGQLIIRDFAKPSRHGPVYLRINSNLGLDPDFSGVPSEEIDYNTLSTFALLKRFRDEFAGGGAFDFEELEIAGQKLIKMEAEWAHEFYLRKDYTANWRQEIKEKYTYWDEEEARSILRAEGFVNVQVVADPNEYILNNRLRGKIDLFVINTDGRLEPIDFPATHMVIVAEKPQNSDSATITPIESVTFEKIFDSIKIDREKGKLIIDEREFVIGDHEIVGTKKNIFRLLGKPSRVIKIARNDTNNGQNVFTSMLQVIERQNILIETATPHLSVLEFDLSGPPYRFLIQEAVPAGSVCAAALIEKGLLTEDEVRQMATIVKKFEIGKLWQLDTNPFGWYRVLTEDGTFKMTYASGKVYKYDENWEFEKVGLLQWLDPQYVKKSNNYSAAIPPEKEVTKLRGGNFSSNQQLAWWRKYLT